MERRVVPSPNPPHLVVSHATTSHSTLGVHDTFRYGLDSIKAQVTPGHPLDSHLKNWDATQEQLKMDMYADVYGSHLPLRLRMEKAYVSQMKRMPVLPSSNFGANILAGRDDTIDVEDFLNRPDMSTESMDVHASMEYMLKMKM
ncbi:hypothetical protein SeMB42_g02647 [Synchytrium endobioticum]|uniref:Proteasome maturation factor UMP1 n=1 Tax=Synchytrium endobioticum TaxID=286115 RepID=A0A507D8H7_9FUNG|nr:hypothetical protein SeLEV6574_g02540 [Synchytrium endobioticum]TPX49326.1 hypothetical protein SeMB42_g02647 [Synchytrium endobioticum]